MLHQINKQFLYVPFSSKWSDGVVNVEVAERYRNTNYNFKIRNTKCLELFMMKREISHIRVQGKVL